MSSLKPVLITKGYLNMVALGQGLDLSIVLFIVLSIVLPAKALASSWQSMETIEQAALKHAKQSALQSENRTEFRVKALDQRLKLARCGTKLETFTSQASSSSATQIIGVRCLKPKPWKVFVPISTLSYRSVVVTNRPLNKGDRIATTDVRLEERDITRIPHRYLTDLDQVEGQVLKQSIQGQTIVNQSALRAADIVKRGQSVALVARTSKLNVRMRGEALADASKNERVRVKNLSSSRIVEGVVLSGQVVLVDY